ncbi:MAG: cytochrome c [Magnetovibrio sp.]|nr:cytochrome c [Magnetovibrio sp.]
MRSFFVIFTIALMAAFSGDAQAGNPIAGKKVWLTNSCPSCHGLDGKSVVPGVPSFSKGERMMKPDAVLVETIIKGAKIMPAWKGILSSKDMFDVITFIRTLRK